MNDKKRTPGQIVEQTLELARKLYRMQGYVAPKGFKFYASGHPHELEAWEMAREAQIFLTDTDPDEALIELGGL